MVGAPLASGDAICLALENVKILHRWTEDVQVSKLLNQNLS